MPDTQTVIAPSRLLRARRIAAIAGLAIVASTVGVAAKASATPPEDDAERIAFAPGTDHGSVTGVVEPNTTRRYVLHAEAGQTMIVIVAAVEENAVFTVTAPDGSVVQPGGMRAFVATLPATGDYRIEVTALPSGATATYGLAVHIPVLPSQDPPSPPTPSGITERIEFAPGTNNARVDGAVVRGTTDQYLLRASAGQTMAVNVDSVEDNAVVYVWAPNGQLLISEQVTATTILPVDGDYVVEVASTRGNATYNLSVWIE